MQSHGRRHTSGRMPFGVTRQKNGGHRLSITTMVLIAATSIVRDHQSRSEIESLKVHLEELLLLQSQSVIRPDAEADVADDGPPAFAALANTSKANINHRQLNPVATETAMATATPHSFTYAANFGIVGDGITDDTDALQRSIDEADSAYNTPGGGGTVILPKGVFLTTSPLIIPAGITVTGQGYGPSPLAISFKEGGGSVIAYCGTDYAVKIEGHAASLNNVAIYDWRGPEGGACDNMKAKGGVLLNADGKLIESVTMSNVFIYWFMGGTSLTLRARNNGGVAFNNFQNIRVRHAHRGISLEAEEGSVVK